MGVVRRVWGPVHCGVRGSLFQSLTWTESQLEGCTWGPEESGLLVVTFVIHSGWPQGLKLSLFFLSPA